MTKHAARRIRQRIGPKTGHEALAEQAFIEGVGSREATGRLLAYLDRFAINGMDAKVWRGVVWVRHRQREADLLITVIPIPHTYARSAKAQQDRLSASRFRRARERRREEVA